MMLVTAGATNVTTYFHLRLAADGTDATGLTITGFDLQYVRSGAAPAAKVDATALAATDSAHGDNQAIEIDATDQPGVYRVDWPDAAFAAGVDEVILTVKVATAFTESLRVRLMSVTRGLAGTALPAAAADAAGGLPISDAGGLDLDAQLVTKINDILTDTGTTLQGELDGIQADTEDIQTRLPAALVGGRIDATVDGTGLEAGALALINAEVDTALADYDAPTKAELDAAVANVSVDEIQATAIADLFNTDSGTTYASAVAGSVVAEIADNAGGSALTEAGIADAVWDEAAAGHVGAGSFGKLAADTKTDTAAILVDTAEIGAAGAGLTEAGGTGDHLTAINLPNQTMDITGNITGNLSGSVGSVTGNVGGNVTGSVGSLGAQAKLDVNAEADTALSDYDPPTRTEATADKDEILTDTGTIAAAVDSILALLDDAQAEPGQGAPAANADVVTKLAYLYKWARNKKENDGTQNLYYNDDGTTVGQKQATTESGGTVTVGEMATGA